MQEWLEIYTNLLTHNREQFLYDPIHENEHNSNVRIITLDGNRAALAHVKNGKHPGPGYISIELLTSPLISFRVIKNLGNYF